MAKQKRVVTVGSGIGAVKTAAGAPLPVVILQEVTVDRSWTTKELESGESLMPEDIAVTGKKITIKAKAGAQYGALLGALVDGVVTVGGVDYAKETPATVSGAHTVTVAHAASWVEDWGLVFADGTLGKAVTGTPAAANEYSVAAGVYTLHASITVPPEIVYGWTNPLLVTVSEGAGQVGNPTMLQLVQAVQYKGAVKNLRFYALRVTKVGESAKGKDHGGFDVDMEAQQDPVTGKVCDTTLSA